ncbi:MAG: enoyl-ACP reductase FabI [Bdellovibrionia bacterium]
MNHSNENLPLLGKKAAVLGVADHQSIAWAIAQSLHQAGAQVTLGYQHKFLSRISPLLEKYPGVQAQRCDVLNPDELEDFFWRFQEDGLDLLIHSIAYAPSSLFTCAASEVSSTDFTETLELSTHSLAKLVRFARPYLRPRSSIVTLTFQASQRAMPLYGMMGVAKAALESLVKLLALELGRENKVRINAVSAGPIETLASLSEIIALKRDPQALRLQADPQLLEILRQVEQELGQETDELQFAKACWTKIQAAFASKSAIQESITAQDVADTIVFLCSDRSKKITGQTLYVDCGFSSCQWI